MKKGLVLLILFLFPCSVYPFWIWSPKTKQWKNPKYSALATPYLQYKAALKIFEEGRYKEAYAEFKKLLANYPDAKEAAESQYYLGRSLEKLDKSYEAFLAYQQLIDSYPNSQRINEVIEREYNIGEYFLNREHKKWLGISLYDFVEHPSIEIFNRLVAKAPYSEYAPRAQYKLGIILFELGRFDEARDAFQKVVDNYSDSEWAAPAKYQLAIATAKAFPGADYDSSYLKEATARLAEFIKNHPEAQISVEAEGQLKILRNREAKKDFEIGQFYEGQNQYKSALIYYQKVIDNYADSDYYSQSLDKIQELNKLLDGNLTKDELKASEKKEAAETKRAEKIRLKERRLKDRQDVRQEKIEAKNLLRSQRLAEKEAVVKEKLKNKIEAKEKSEFFRQERLKTKQELFRKKAVLAQNKKEEKLKRIQVKKELKRAKSKEKLAKKLEAKAQKQALKEQRKKEALLKKQKAKAKKMALEEKKRKEKLARGSQAQDQ
ncbi:MAG: outer membrane protein assembly factor BamD [Candidatus Omnitrophica bacterium]|nr:outer membrane protein assembly factor BamD [Candidatus Omnitrophota bacterium]MBU2251325.1 outer membrane protein assembly factor BamD [Candidatus Omnitrophota bacterium]MBU2473289.1 outer membrane protein assembly factor BamD [Candidatus Omnitrophota bacterium]